MSKTELPNVPTRMPNEDERFDEWWASACALPPYTLEHLRWAFNAGGMTQRMLNSSREQSKGTPWICQQCGLKNYPDDPECRDAMCGGMRGDLQDAKQSECPTPGKNVLETIEQYRKDHPGALEKAEAEMIAEEAGLYPYTCPHCSTIFNALYEQNFPKCPYCAGELTWWPERPASATVQAQSKGVCPTCGASDTVPGYNACGTCHHQKSKDVAQEPEKRVPRHTPGIPTSGGSEGAATAAEQLYRKRLCERCEGGRKCDPYRCPICQGHKYRYEPVTATVQAFRLSRKQMRELYLTAQERNGTDAFADHLRLMGIEVDAE